MAEPGPIPGVPRLSGILRWSVHSKNAPCADPWRAGQLTEETGHQENLSAQEALPEEGARVSRPDVDPRRRPRAQAQTAQGSLASDARAGAVNKSFRLRKTAEFERVRAERRTAGDRLLRVQVRGNHLGHPRVGISASKRVGCAVQRNLVRRRLLMAVAAEMPRLEAVDFVVIPSPQGARSPFPALVASLRNSLDILRVRSR